MPKFCHKLVEKTAKDMAWEAYEARATDNVFYKQFPNQRKYVAHNWKHFIRFARETLVRMLGMPQYSEHLKEEIFEALMLEQTIPQGDAVQSVPQIH